MKIVKARMRVCVKKNIDPSLDPGRWRGTCGKVIRESKRYKDQWWVKMDGRKISRTDKIITGDSRLWHKDDLVKERKKATKK